MIPVRVQKYRGLPSRWLDSLADANMFSDLDTLVDRVFRSHNGGQVWYRANVREDNEKIYIEVDMPGLTAQDVAISYEDGMLRIEGEHKAPECDKDQYHLCERQYGKFVRTFQLPNVVDPDSIDAAFANGVLTITLTKRPETKARQIKIKG